MGGVFEHIGLWKKKPSHLLSTQTVFGAVQVEHFQGCSVHRRLQDESSVQKRGNRIHMHNLRWEVNYSSRAGYEEHPVTKFKIDSCVLFIVDRS